jgi:hypothetical protein
MTEFSPEELMPLLVNGTAYRLCCPLGRDPLGPQP